MTINKVDHRRSHILFFFQQSVFARLLLSVLFFKLSQISIIILTLKCVHCGLFVRVNVPRPNAATMMDSDAATKLIT